jgi:dTDP-4-amino-4,6-dideoxygalactose transaminase
MVWTVPNTFVASANCALYCGADIDFVDIDPETSNMSIECLRTKLKLAQSSGNLPKVIIPVHLTGESCEMLPIKRLSDEFGFKVIEDASHAIGGKYAKTAIGASTYSDITVFSFHPVKIITSGEGGAALTNDQFLDQKMKLLRSHGITRDHELMTNPTDASWYYEQIDLGFNYRMSDILAALGASQLERVDDYVKKRHEIASVYDREFASSNMLTPKRNPENFSALHLYVIRVDATEHKAIFNALLDDGIGVNLHYIPVHTQPYYQKLGFNWGDYPNSEAYYRRAISLPIYPTLESEQQKFIIKIVKNLCDG